MTQETLYGNDGKVYGNAEFTVVDGTHINVHVRDEAPLIVNRVQVTLWLDYTKDGPNGTWRYTGGRIYRAGRYNGDDLSWNLRRKVMDAVLGKVNTVAMRHGVLTDAERVSLLRQADRKDAQAESLRKDADKAEAEAVALREQAAGLI